MSHSAHPENLESRIRRLEKQNRWMKRSGIAMVVLAVVALITGQAAPRPNTVPQSIEARRFTLIDDDGTPRAVLGIEGSKASLMFFDKESKSRVVLGVGDQGQSGLTFWGPRSGEPAVIGFYDESHSPQAILGPEGFWFLGEIRNRCAVLCPTSTMSAPPGSSSPTSDSTAPSLPATPRRTPLANGPKIGPMYGPKPVPVNHCPRAMR